MISHEPHTTQGKLKYSFVFHTIQGKFNDYKCTSCNMASQHNANSIMHHVSHTKQGKFNDSALKWWRKDCWSKDQKGKIQLSKRKHPLLWKSIYA